MSFLARWYRQATLGKPLILPRDIKRETRVQLHRLRLGCRCVAEIRTRTESSCNHCHQNTTEPLLHYLLECPHTKNIRHLTGTPDTDPLADHAFEAATGVVQEACQDHLEVLIMTTDEFPPPR